jgi:UDP-glucose 4-epimerase
MRALVTGGAGFLGSHIADELTARGHDVTIFDLEDTPWRSQAQQLVIGDITDASVVAAAVEGQDVVFHLAALADLDQAKTRPVDTWRVNIGGTLNVLEACRQNGVRRLAFASTVYVYSREGGFYRCSKQACESYIEEYARRYNIDYIILRYGSLYGPRADEGNGVFRYLKQAVEKGTVECGGTPNDVRNYIHARDAAVLSVDALDDAYIGQHLVLTGQDSLRLRDLFQVFEELIGANIDIRYHGEANKPGNDDHYSITPYAYTPKPGKKLVANPYVDIGQGLLEMVEAIDRKIDR